MPPGFDHTPPSIVIQTSDTATFPQGCPSGFPPTGTPGEVCWSLDGKGVRADILAVPKEIDFDSVPLGCGSDEETITLYNIGGDAIAVQPIELRPAEASEFFRVEGGNTAFTIPVGGQRVLRVRFIPPADGPAQLHDAVIRIVSDASNAPQVDVPLQGSGTTQSHQTDTFTQPERAATDVLFVVDDSGSMGEEQSLLASNALKYIQVAEELENDYRMAVISTDMADPQKSGRFQGSTRVVTPSTPYASGVLANNINELGTSGSGTEKGLQAMVDALSEPLISDENAGFLRDEANLSVVVVSDEDDFSSGEVESYVDFLRSFKGPYNAHLVKLHAIVGPPGGCQSKNGDATAGERYIAVQTATGGLFQSICQQDWGDMARQTAIMIFDGFRGYRLTRVPDPDRPITVTVNGTEAPAGTWEYDPEGNSIVFNSNHVPAGGSEIEVSYETRCFAIE